MASFEHESQFFRSVMNVLQNLRWISQNKNSKDGTPRKETLAHFKEVRSIFKYTLLTEDLRPTSRSEIKKQYRF